MNFILIVISCILFAFLNSTSSSITKSQLQTTQLVSIQSYIQILSNVKAMIGFSLILISELVLFKTLSIGESSIINPLFKGINYICTITIGYFYFHNRIVISQIFNYKKNIIHFNKW